MSRTVIERIEFPVGSVESMLERGRWSFDLKSDADKVELRLDVPAWIAEEFEDD